MTERVGRVLRVDSVEVTEHELVALVRVLDPTAVRTSAVQGLAEKALTLLPGLARHRCDNDAGLRFEMELRDTETAHLLEHITIEFMALAGSPRELRANTSWDFARDGRGVFRLTIVYDDDVVALGSLKAATEVVEWLFECGSEPDITAIARDLRAMRER